MTEQDPRDPAVRSISSLRSRGSAPFAVAVGNLLLERQRLAAAGERLRAGAGTLFAVRTGLEHLDLQPAVCADVHLAGLHLAARCHRPHVLSCATPMPRPRRPASV